MSNEQTTITIPALRPGERIELHASEDDVEWTFWGAETRTGCSGDILLAAEALTAAINEVRENV